MRTLIISDTHGKHDGVDEILEREGEFDMLIHLGDVEGGEIYLDVMFECPKYIVRGNNDFFAPHPYEEEFDLGPHHIMITHGHHYHVSTGPEILKEEALSIGADVVMFGHTHRPYFEQDEEITVLNPGSVSYPRQEGRQGSYMIMEMDADGTLKFEQKFL